MSEADGSEESFANRLFFRLVFGIVLLVALYGALLVYLTWPIQSYNIGAAGTFGDSFGLLTSIFSGVAFAGLIWTILLQRAELRLQRKELSESRRQAVLTRLMTVTQNQVATYRAEVASLQFESIASPGDRIGTTEMIYTMTAFMEQMAQKEELDGSEFPNYLYAIATSLRSYQPLVHGLARCCKSNRLLLTNESITADEANDLKAHMFADLPPGLMNLITQMNAALEGFGKKVRPKGLTKADLFDPIRGLESACGQIVSHEAHVFTDENMAMDRKEKWLFR